MPPGPWSIPLVGVFYRISGTRPHQTYTEWAHKYGDVMSFTLFGTQKAVVVSSETAIREVLVNKQDQGHMPFLLFELPKLRSSKFSKSD